MNERNRNGIVEKAYRQGWLSGFDFSILIQDFLVSPGGYVMDTGNWENVNAAVALELWRRVKRHPVLWELFFMVA